MSEIPMITAEELDAKFDAGEDISDYVDWSKAERPGAQQQRVNVDLPMWMLNAIDQTIMCRMNLRGKSAPRTA